MIDDYDPARHTRLVQFSNFYVFENRETQEFELYLSPYGRRPMSAGVCPNRKGFRSVCGRVAGRC